MVPTPNVYCLVSGTGEGVTELNAFDKALLEAGIGDTNLVKMSSIVPPACKRVESLELPKGGLVPVAYAAMESSLQGELIAAAIGVGIPEDDTEPGVIMEYHGHCSAEEAKAMVTRMVEDAFDYRNRTLKEIQTVEVDYRVVDHGGAFAGAVLWYAGE